jgi:NAD(P)-dependent dehydrogenase (short-subunit alcohol dehydrogenase family)
VPERQPRPAPVGLVTGASRGIGRAIAEDLLAHGWRVAALARDAERLSDLAADQPDRVLPLVADVADPAAVAAAVAPALDRWGAPDLVVANAGVLAAVGPTWQVDPDLWWREFEVNVRGVHATLAATLPAMLERGSGRVVVVSSGMGRAPAPWSSAYGASKAAVTHLVGSLAGELAGSGVTAFAISPGMVATDMTDWPAGLLAHRPHLAELPAAAYLPASEACGLVRDLASGRLDALAGRFVHVREDRDALLAEAQRDARA